MLYQKFQRDNYEYSIELVLGEDQLQEGKLGWVITGTMLRLDEENAEAQQVELHLDVDFEGRLVTVYHDDEIVGEFALDLPGFEAVFENAQELPLSLGAEDAALAALENIIENLPAVDPILGCLLKSAASTAVGQTIRCWRKVRDDFQGAVNVARQVAKCLKEHGWQIAATFVFRAARCILTGGIPMLWLPLET